MAILNLYLTTQKALTKEDVKHIHPNWTKRQLNALSVILANLITYKKFWVRYESRNQANVIPRYNHLNIGHKAMLGVIQKLSDDRLIEVIHGIGIYQATEDSPAMQTEMSLTARGLHRTLKLGIRTDNITRIADEYFCILRKDNKKSTTGIDYIDDDYSRYTEQVMRTYHDYLHKQIIKLDRNIIDYPKLNRKYRARGNTNKLMYGGRSSGYWMQMKKEERARIKINGKNTVSCDFPSSTINILYLIETGKMFGRKDGYQVNGIPRDIVKAMVNRMINNKSRQGCTMAFSAYVEKQATRDERVFMKLSPLTSRDIQNRILEHHSKIAQHFYKGADYGQRVAWVEQNVVFDIASQLALMDVPVLTVHDEFICKREDEALVWEAMYSTFHQFKEI